MTTDAGSSHPGRAGTIAAAAATLTAIVAVVIAMWDNVQTRRHNRLSVLPYVVIERLQQDSAGVGKGSDTAGALIQALLDGLRLRLRYASVYGDVAEVTLGEDQ